MQLTLGEIANIVGGELRGVDAPVRGVSIDTRTIKKDELYVPIIGEVFDGHRFMEAAIKNGGSGTLSQVDTPLNHIRVDSTLRAFQALARAYRERFDIPMVGITGSVGKTTTKEMVYSVLSQRFNTLKTLGNLNNQTGVPQVLLKLESCHEAAILELGTNHFGEIEQLSKMVQPTICLFTNVGTAHIEFLGSRDGILKAKAEMLKHMRPSATIIVNGDDDKLNTLPAHICYGFGEHCNVRAVELHERGMAGTDFTAVLKDWSLRLRVPVAGRHMVQNALAAIAVASVLGMDRDDIKRGIEGFVPSAGRAQVLQAGSITVINDAYNANPTSMCASIDMLTAAEGRKVAILGDMFELGANEQDYHASVLRHARDKGIDKLILVGKTFCSVADDNTTAFQSKADLQQSLGSLIESGDTVLVKASHSMHLESIVKQLCELF